MSANTDLVMNSLDQFAKGEIEAFLGNLHPECVWLEPEGSTLAGQWVGAQDILTNLFMPLAATWEWKHTALIGIVEDGDTVYVRGVEEGRYLATGKSATSPFVHVLKIKDGKLASFEHIFDTAVFKACES